MFPSPVPALSDLITSTSDYLAPSLERNNWICWVVEEGALHLVYCPTNDMVADVLMKVLPSPKVKHFAACLGLRAK